MLSDIIWDFDGTLFNTYPETINAFIKALKDNGIDETSENILSYVKISEGCAVKYFSELYGLGDTFIEKFNHYKSKLDYKIIRPFPFAIEVCKKILTLGGRNYIITHRGDSTLKLLKYHGMEHYFTEIITKKYGFKRKPDPEAFLYLIEKYKINKSKALVIGDRECEILGAKAVGIKACLFNTNDVEVNELPEFNIDSLQKVIDIIG